MFSILDANPINTVYVKAGTGGLTAGGLVVATGSGTSVTGIKATAGVSAATVIGIARTSVAANAYTYVDSIENHILSADYTGSSKTSVADSDGLAVFDISDESTINLDDTTGGCFMAGFGYDNTNKKIIVKLVDSFKLA